MDSREHEQSRTALSPTASSASPVTQPRIAQSRLIRCAWFGLGWLAVAVGGVGVVVPGLPTTGFMIIAAACFARCSPRFEQWVLHLPVVGRSVADYRSGLGMPVRAKIAAVSMMGLAISISVVLFLESTVARLAVVAIGAIGVWYVTWRVPTARQSPPRT